MPAVADTRKTLPRRFSQDLSAVPIVDGLWASVQISKTASLTAISTVPLIDSLEKSAELLNTLIEKIVIHEAITVDGMREQNIDIYYRLIGKIE